MAANKPRPAVLKDVTLTLGLLRCAVALVPLKRSTKSSESTDVKTTNICPKCSDPHELKHLTVCGHLPGEHGPFEKDELHKAVMKDGVLARVDADTLHTVKTPTTSSRTVELAVFPAKEVEQHTLPSGNLYGLRPQDPRFYLVLRELVADTNLAFVGEVTVKGVTKLYRLVARGEGVALVELVRPDDLEPAEPVTGDLDTALVEQGRLAVAMMVGEFVPEQWADRVQERLRALRDQLSEVVPAEPPVNGSVAELLAGVRAVSTTE